MVPMLALWLLLGLAAEAPTIPDVLAIPPGCAIEKVEQFEYDREEFGVPGAPGGRKEVTGRATTIHFVAKAREAADWEHWPPLLKATGWTVTKAVRGEIVARKEAGGWWLKGQTYGARLLQEREVPPLEMLAPGVEPETLAKGADIPFLPPLPEAKLTQWQPAVSVEYTTPGAEPRHFLSVTIDYGGPRTWTGTEIQGRYSKGLANAGWDVKHSPVGGVTIAHFTKGARDIWAKVTPRGGSLRLDVADIGLESSAAKLKAALAKDGHVIVSGIYFDLDKAELRSDSEPALSQVRALLAGEPKLSVEVQGHTDASGSREHNDTLSRARAESVVAWLSGHGVAAGRLNSQGYADTQPVADNKTPEGRAKNRRVVIKKR
jgi:outer membrane protein OmpA-like peptidoglycan-associated protein